MNIQKNKECLHSFYHLILKKCLDHVKHKSVYHTMRYFNFGENLITWVEIVQERFLISTQNLGFIFEWNSPQKALFQDTPTSSYLYLLLGQVVSDRLLENHSIKPIMVQGEPVLLSQYADDTDIYMMYNQASYQALISTWEDFSKHTGLQINYKKSMVSHIGALGCNSVKLSSSKKLTWSNDTINVLEIKVNLHDKDTIFVNYMPLLE